MSRSHLAGACRLSLPFPYTELCYTAPPPPLKKGLHWKAGDRLAGWLVGWLVCFCLPVRRCLSQRPLNAGQTLALSAWGHREVALEERPSLAGRLSHVARFGPHKPRGRSAAPGARACGSAHPGGPPPRAYGAILPALCRPLLAALPDLLRGFDVLVASTRVELNSILPGPVARGGA